MATIHLAGPFGYEEPGLQRCTRCGMVLLDYRNTMVPDGTPAAAGFKIGASVGIARVSPNIQYQYVIEPEGRPLLSAGGETECQRDP